MEVLDGALTGKEYIVGDRLTIADISYVPWTLFQKKYLDGSHYAEDAKKFKHYMNWLERVSNYSPVKKCLQIREQLQNPE